MINSVVPAEEGTKSTKYTDRKMTPQRRSFTQQHARVHRHERDALFEDFVTRMHPCREQERDSSEQQPIARDPADGEKPGENAEALKEDARKPKRDNAVTNNE